MSIIINEKHILNIFNSLGDRREIGDLEIIKLKARPSKEKLKLIYGNGIGIVESICEGSESNKLVNKSVLTDKGNEILRWKEKDELNNIYTVMLLDDTAIRFTDGRIRFLGHETPNNIIATAIAIVNYKMNSKSDQVLLSIRGDVLSVTNEWWPDRFISQWLMKTLKNSNKLDINSKESQYKYEKIIGTKYILKVKLYDTLEYCGCTEYFNIVDIKNNNILLDYMAYNIRKVDNNILVVYGSDGNRKRNQILEVVGSEIKVLVESASNIAITNDNNIIVHKGIKRYKLVLSKEKALLLRYGKLDYNDEDIQLR